jgi:hypothetical protein
MEEPNFSYLNSFTGGDKAFEEKILTVLKKEFPEERDVYLKNIQTKNFNLAAKNVHKIKHKISLLGLEVSYVLANQHELNLNEDNNNLDEKFNEILETMTRFLNEL